MRMRQKKGMPPQIMEVAFVLTFMFLILSTMANPDALERMLPNLDLSKIKAQQEGATEAKAAVISVAEGPIYYLDQEEIAIGDLGKMLAQRNPASVQLRADQQVAYGAVQQVIGICMEAGIYQVALGYEVQ